MKHRLARRAVLLVSALGLVAPTTPAEATTVKVVTFHGTARLAHGMLGYPCTSNNMHECPPWVTTTPKPGPKNVPVVNITPGGNRADFNFTSDVCLKDSYSTPDKPTQKNGIGEPCVISAVGSMRGFCGLSTGTGILTLNNLAGTKGNMNTISVGFKFTDVGGVLHVTGGSSTQWLVAEIVAVPSVTVGWPGCLQKWAREFTFTGTAVFVDKTPLR